MLTLLEQKFMTIMPTAIDNLTKQLEEQTKAINRLADILEAKRET